MAKPIIGLAQMSWWVSLSLNPPYDLRFNPPRAWHLAARPPRIPLRSMRATGSCQLLRPKQKAAAGFGGGLGRRLGDGLGRQRGIRAGIVGRVHQRNDRRR